MPIKANKIVELEDIALAMRNRRNGTALPPPKMAAVEVVQPVVTSEDKLKMSYFLVNKESEYLDHNIRNNRR